MDIGDSSLWNEALRWPDHLGRESVRRGEHQSERSGSFIRVVRFGEVVYDAVALWALAGLSSLRKDGESAVANVEGSDRTQPRVAERLDPWRGWPLPGGHIRALPRRLFAALRHGQFTASQEMSPAHVRSEKARPSLLDLRSGGIGPPNARAAPLFDGTTAVGAGTSVPPLSGAKDHRRARNRRRLCGPRHSSPSPEPRSTSVCASSSKSALVMTSALRGSQPCNPSPVVTLFHRKTAVMAASATSSAVTLRWRA